MWQWFGYSAVGAVIGFMSGLFGVGGSSISTPLLKMLFGLPDLVALASPLPVTIPAAASGAYSYWRRGLVRKDVALWTIVGGLPGVVLGALGTRVVVGPWLMTLTGVFVLLVGVRLLLRDRPSGGKNGEAVRRSRATPLTAGLIGAVVGVLSGLLANGGGFLLVPAFVLLLGLSMQEAASTSLVCVAFFAIPGSLVHWWLGNINWPLVAALSLGVFPAGFLGARVGLRISGARTRTAFGLFLAIFGFDFILQQFGLGPPASYLMLGLAIAVAGAWLLPGLFTQRAAGGAPEKE